MRPVRFVALSEDGHALVLADEVGRLLALPRDDRVAAALHDDADQTAPGPAPSGAGQPAPSLSPRDIQARIRAGESADEVARITGVPVDRVLRYAGPVLQERAMLAQHARRTRLKTADGGGSLAEVVDGRLDQHGVDAEKISWDAYRRDDGTWRVVATWPSGKATAQAVWELDKARTLVSPHDDMAHYLCTERPTPILGQEEAVSGERETTRRPGRTRPRSEPSRGGHGLPAPADDGSARRPVRDPIRSGRDALMATLDRPLGASGRGLDTPAAAEPARQRATQRPNSPFEDDADAPKEVPAVPSLAVLRPRRPAGGDSGSDTPSRNRGPSWDEVLFGSPPAARESS